jgi:hypothetical protein
LISSKNEVSEVSKLDIIIIHLDFAI